MSDDDKLVAAIFGIFFVVALVLLAGVWFSMKSIPASPPSRSVTEGGFGYAVGRTVKTVVVEDEGRSVVIHFTDGRPLVLRAYKYSLKTDLP